MSDPTASHPYYPYHPLFGCQLKFRRAQVHADALSNAINEFIGSEPYEVVHDFESEPPYHLAWFQVREGPSPLWSPLIGDIIYNFRSALAHLAWQWVLRNGRKPSGGVAFPIFTIDPFDPDTHPSTEEHERALKRWNTQTKGMHPSDIALLRLLQPYKKDANSGPLARLNQLSNWDKHREFHFAAQSFVDHCLGATMKNARIKLLYLKPRGEILKDGEVIARYEVFSTGRNPKLDMNLKIFFDIAFGEGSPLERLGIKEALHAIARHTGNNIVEFKSRFDE